MEFTKDIKFGRKPMNNKYLKLTYSGNLFKKGSSDVSIVYGFGENWEKTNEQKMQKLPVGFRTHLLMENYDTFNFCFKNSNNEWDNNNGFNYITPIEKNYHSSYVTPTSKEKYITNTLTPEVIQNSKNSEVNSNYKSYNDSNNYSETTDSISNVSSETTENVSNVSSETTEKVSDVSSETTENVSSVSSEATENVSNVSSETTENVSNVSSETIENVSDVSSDTTENVSDVSSDTTENVSDASSETIENVSDVSSETTENVSDVSSETTENVSDVSSDTTENISDKITFNNLNTLIDNIIQDIQAKESEIKKETEYTSVDIGLELDNIFTETFSKNSSVSIQPNINETYLPETFFDDVFEIINNDEKIDENVINKNTEVKNDIFDFENKDFDFEINSKNINVATDYRQFSDSFYDDEDFSIHDSFSNIQEIVDETVENLNKETATNEETIELVENNVEEYDKIVAEYTEYFDKLIDDIVSAPTSYLSTPTSNEEVFESEKTQLSVTDSENLDIQNTEESNSTTDVTAVKDEYALYDYKSHGIFYSFMHRCKLLISTIFHKLPTIFGRQTENNDNK